MHFDFYTAFLKREFPNYHFEIFLVPTNQEIMVLAVEKGPWGDTRKTIKIPHPENDFPSDAFFAKCLLVL